MSPFERCEATSKAAHGIFATNAVRGLQTCLGVQGKIRNLVLLPGGRLRCWRAETLVPQKGERAPLRLARVRTM